MKRRLRERIVLAGSIIFGITFWSNYAYSATAMVLPQGRSRLSFAYAQTDGVNSQYDVGGNKESITQPYDLNLDSQTLRKFDSQISSLVDQLNKLGYHYDASQKDTPYHGISKDGNGPLLGDALTPGSLNVTAQAYREEFVLSYQYGLTDRLTVGFGVPIIKMQVSGDAQVTGTNTAGFIGNFVTNMNGNSSNQLKDGLKLLANANKATLQSVLESRDYSGATSWNQNGVGDVVLGGRYNYLKSDNHLWLSSAQFGASAPTGALKDPSQPLAVDFGQGAWDLTVSNIFNYIPTNWLTLSNTLSYGHHLKSSRQLRVEDSPGEFLPNAADQQEVSMQLGDQYEANFGMDLKLTKSVTFSTSYDWAWKANDVYSGSRDIDYSYLSDDSNTYQKTVQAGVSVSTIPAFMKSEFPVPVDIAFNVYIPTGGRNVPITPYGTAELALYF
jgi:hypothetical protein